MLITRIDRCVGVAAAHETSRAHELSFDPSQEVQLGP